MQNRYLCGNCGESTVSNQSRCAFCGLICGSVGLEYNPDELAA